MAWYISNSVTTENQRKNNAFELYNYVLEHDGNANVAAALCGNAEVESYINPGVWQGLTVGSGGLGLFQWTPYTKLQDWCSGKGIPWRNGDNQMRCLYEKTGEWFNINNTATHPSTWLGQYYMPFKDFLVSTQPPSFLGGVFVCSFERPGSVLYGDRASQEKTITYRGELADKWYQILTGEKPPINPEYDWDTLPDEIKYGIYANTNKTKQGGINYVIYL